MAEVWDDFSIDVSTAGGDATVVVTGELDMLSAPTLLTELELLGDRVGRRVTIDMAAVTFIDSTGIRGLIAARDHLLGLNCRLVIGPCSERVNHVLDLAGMGKVFSDEDLPPS